MGLVQKLTGIATAISHKTGHPASEYTLDEMQAGIESIQTAFPTPEPEDDWCARFMDYDGTIITELTYEQVQALTSLPELPTHPEIGVATGWSENLNTIKDTPEDGKIMVGAIYAPNINVEDEFEGVTNGNITTLQFKPQFVKTITLAFTTNVDGGVTIDWGDGNTSTSGSAGQQEMSHTYDDETDVLIQIIPLDNCEVWLGYEGQQKNMFGLTSSTSTLANFPVVTKMAVGRANFKDYAMAWNRRIESCVLSNNVTTLGNYFFQNNYALTSIVIPTSVTSIGTYFFSSNYALKSIVIPSSVTSIGNFFFQYNYALTSIVIPSSVTSIGQSFVNYNYALTSIVISTSVTSIGTHFFGYNYALKSIVIPSSVTSIGQSFFGANCALTSIIIPSSVTSIGNNIFNQSNFITSFVFEDRNNVWTNSWLTDNSNPSYLDFRAQTTVPTVSSANFFSGLLATTSIIVPDDLYEDFIEATNWSTVASQIIKASDWEA